LASVFYPIVVNVLMAYLIAMTLLAVIVVSNDLDHRLKIGQSNRGTQLLIRLPLWFTSIAALILVPGIIWRKSPELDSNIGATAFVVSLGLFCAVVFVYARTRERE